IGFVPINESYRSFVRLDEPKLVHANCVDGKIFRQMLTIWKFHEMSSKKNSCQIHFHIVFEFRSAMYCHLSTVFFDKVVKQMVGAFLKEAQRQSQIEDEKIREKFSKLKNATDEINETENVFLENAQENTTDLLRGVIEEYDDENAMPFDKLKEFVEVDLELTTDNEIEKIKEKKNDVLIESTSEINSDAIIKQILKKKEKIKDDSNEHNYFERIKILRNSSNDLMKFSNGMKMSKKLYNSLFKFQVTGVRWLWELHQKDIGGILADEMGLGKTIQIIAFISTIRTSERKTAYYQFSRKKFLGPILIICPLSVIEHWLNKFHEYAPEFRIFILHSMTNSGLDYKFIIESANNTQDSILITSYGTLIHYGDWLTEHQWHYIILDEGDRIKNYETKRSQIVKKFDTPHRLILTAAPIQNSLKELWSLFNFVAPSKLGEFNDFESEFLHPIMSGTCANAIEYQMNEAKESLKRLKGIVAPFMFRRTKTEQYDLYERLLEDEFTHNTMQKLKFPFRTFMQMRFLCNHPDIFLRCKDDSKEYDKFMKNLMKLRKGEINVNSSDYGKIRKSGKMSILKKLLKHFHQFNHKVLLFSQSIRMLDIIENFLLEHSPIPYKYRRMDGDTSAKNRPRIVEEFNLNKNIFLFLLSTKVGGIGLNLTGADRIIIFDPDWNPSNDLQAKERAWRIGQTKEVNIYRFITPGTIEEMIYHRQICKMLISNRILHNHLNHRNFLKSNSFFDLFQLKSPLIREEKKNDNLLTDTDILLKPIEEEDNNPLIISNRKDFIDLKRNNHLARAHQKELKKILKLQNVRSIIMNDNLMNSLNNDIITTNIDDHIEIETIKEETKTSQKVPQRNTKSIKIKEKLLEHNRPSVKPASFLSATIDLTRRKRSIKKTDTNKNGKKKKMEKK
ncbi:hypothetical protein SNEBB_000050, partial [Seison nebaliae]